MTQSPATSELTPIRAALGGDASGILGRVRTNVIPEGYCLGWDEQAMPLWLRLWHRFPMFDSDPTKAMLDRGYAWLIPLDGHEHKPVPTSWRVERGLLRRREN